MTIERTAGFTQNVTMHVVYPHQGSTNGDGLPPGVTVDDMVSLMLLTGDAHHPPGRPRRQAGGAGSRSP
ncbi:MAG: putative serine proteinase, subtilase family [Gemmataceae bacterium]|nr:putative serine proteinase, subtilase family [Gemmataceae bacterium]